MIARQMYDHFALHLHRSRHSEPHLLVDVDGSTVCQFHSEPEDSVSHSLGKIFAGLTQGCANTAVLVVLVDKDQIFTTFSRLHFKEDGVSDDRMAYEGKKVESLREKMLQPRVPPVLRSRG